MVDYNFPNSSFEGSFTIKGKVSNDFLNWAFQQPDPKKTLEQIEKFMKEYNIPKENMVADRSSLKWLFLSD